MYSPLIINCFVINAVYFITGQGSKLGGPKKKLKKKKGGSWLPLLFIPLLIQIKIIPFIVLKLKMLATKALLMGKLALIILAFNAIRTAYLGSDNIDSQYEKVRCTNKPTNIYY
ncbi:hypothetical protein AAG570_000340 [Ranatra chinensis]|uniref:Uncharacterized protein n=1 Tax=Ranatra chinensis TaxID=642074 RepID=A0ABD0ZHZ5_9HEMI